jgi:hypothetical protein
MHDQTRRRPLAGNRQRESEGHGHIRIRQRRWCSGSRRNPHIVGAAVLVAILISFYLVYQRSRRTRRRLVMERLEGYFQGDVPAEQLGKRIREIAGRHFVRDTELYSLVIAAFQGAVDARPDQTLSDEKKL